MSTIELRQGDCLELIKGVASESVDCILTDPPYLYLKHKLDRPFDEDSLFAEFWRVLKPKGFVVIFGRGVSLARWVCKLDTLGFQFKEEVVWNKMTSTSPTLPLKRTHELVYILSKGKGVINKVRIPFEEACIGLNEEMIYQRLSSCLNAVRRSRTLEEVRTYIEEGVVVYGSELRTNKSQISLKQNNMPRNREVFAIRHIYEGLREGSVIYCKRNHFTAVHPTQKPVRLLERLLALTTQEGAMVLDPFAGSGSTLVACRNTGRSALGFEIDAEYYQQAQQYIAS